MTNKGSNLTAEDVLQRYRDDDLLEYCDGPLIDVNQRGLFGDFPIHIAAVRGDLEEIKALVGGGADVNAVGERCETPLHAAVGQNHLEAAQLLLECGASVKAKRDDGRTPLDIAKLMGRIDLMDLLSDKRAQANQ